MARPRRRGRIRDIPSSTGAAEPQKRRKVVAFRKRDGSSVSFKTRPK